MTNLTAPAQPLTDGVVTLRLPSVAAGDVGAVLSYIEQEQLDGGWLPEIPLVSAEQAIGDWLDAWAARPSRNGATFVVTVSSEPRFIGIVGLVDRGEGIVEMIYGIAPRWRGRGLASRAVRLASHLGGQPARRQDRRAADRSGLDRLSARRGQRRVRGGRNGHPVRSMHWGDLRGPAIRSAKASAGGVAVLVFRSCRRQDPGERAARDGNRIRTIRALPG
jgi:Acetyltransferase (GNAT) domain